jgi:MFS family permease
MYVSDPQRPGYFKTNGQIDKTTLSYAAIFGIEEDLGLVGREYSWLSSVFYFGFLVWSFPTNLLMQRFPVGKYLGANIFLWGFFLMLQGMDSINCLCCYLFD